MVYRLELSDAVSISSWPRPTGHRAAQVSGDEPAAIDTPQFKVSIPIRRYADRQRRARPPGRSGKPIITESRHTARATRGDQILGAVVPETVFTEATVATETEGVGSRGRDRAG